jgi:hypothetical protein
MSQLENEGEGPSTSEDKGYTGTSNQLPPEDPFARIGRDFVQSGLYQQGTADRTADLLKAATDWAEKNGVAQVARVNEPGTGVESAIILRPGGSVAVLPEEVFDTYRPGPKRRTGTAHFSRIESLVEHVNLFKGATSVLFAHESKTEPKLTAVLDYHQTTVFGEVDEYAQPGWMEHRDVHAFPLSEEWKAWHASNGKWLNPREFAEFLEDRFVDVEQVQDYESLNEDIRKLLATVGRDGLATPSSLFELSGGLTISENVIVGGHQKLANGTAEIMLKTEHTGAVNAAGQSVTVPSLFIIIIPVFQGSPDYYRIAVRLRHRTTNGLAFRYELWGADRVMRQAFEDACANASEATGLPLLFGTPES